jgi:hypothetical protein
VGIFFSILPGRTRYRSRWDSVIESGER